MKAKSTSLHELESSLFELKTVAEAKSMFPVDEKTAMIRTMLAQLEDYSHNIQLRTQTVEWENVDLIGSYLKSSSSFLEHVDGDVASHLAKMKSAVNDENNLNNISAWGLAKDYKAAMKIGTLSDLGFIDEMI